MRCLQRLTSRYRRYHGRKISGSRTIRSFSNDDGDGYKKAKKQCVVLHLNHTFLYISMPSLHDCDVDCDMKLPNFTRSLNEVGEQNTKILFFFF